MIIAGWSARVSDPNLPICYKYLDIWICRSSAPNINDPDWITWSCSLMEKREIDGSLRDTLELCNSPAKLHPLPPRNIFPFTMHRQSATGSNSPILARGRKYLSTLRTITYACAESPRFSAQTVGLKMLPSKRLDGKFLRGKKRAPAHAYTRYIPLNMKILY